MKGGKSCRFQKVQFITVQLALFDIFNSAEFPRFHFPRKHTFSIACGLRLSSPGIFSILRLASDTEGYIYVVDSANDRIQKFSSDGHFATNGKEPVTGNLIYHPVLQQIMRGFLYVADNANNHTEIQFRRSVCNEMGAWEAERASLTCRMELQWITQEMFIDRCQETAGYRNSPRTAALSGSGAGRRRDG
ncbi:MAG: hypothetical protein R2941_07705 [Desulfobacterales bacterium]